MCGCVNDLGFVGKLVAWVFVGSLMMFFVGMLITWIFASTLMTFFHGYVKLGFFCGYVNK